MSKILNKASLLLNPAGSSIAYKEDKIYSVFPNNGDGDFTFSGGDGGTRVNQDGYIEEVPRNLITNSAVISAWTKDASLTRTDNQPDPFGTNTASKFSNNLSGGSPNNAYIYKNVNYIAGETYTFSLYIKGDSAGSISMRYDDGTTGPEYGVNYTTEWQRFDVTRTVNSTSGIFVLGGYGYWTPGENISFAFAQHEKYPTPRPYQPTTDRLNYPRISYQNGKGVLLSEQDKTNINLFSTGPTGSFTTSGNANSDGRYFYSKATLINKTSLSPDGTNNAYEMEMHNSSYDMYSRFNGLTVGDNYVFSMHVKLGTARNFCVVINDTSAWNTVTGSVFTAPELSDQHYTRVEVPFTVPASGQVNVHLGGHSENMTQQDAGTVFLYGSQMEEGEFVSSYIPTTSATVTRPTDFAQNNFTENTLAPTNGTTVLYDIELGGQFNVIPNQGGFNLKNNAGTNTRLNFNYGYDRIYSNFPAGSTVQFLPSSETILGKRYKVAFQLINGGKSFVNGNYRSTTTKDWSSDTIGEVEVSFGQQLRTLAIFPEILSDAQCQELTTVRSGSGGDISYYGPYSIHTFTSSGTFTPSFSGEVEVLVVAGGGGGGSRHGGGGGAGGVVHSTSYAVTQGIGINIIVGSGGAGAPAGSSNNGYPGSDSSFGGLGSYRGGLGSSAFGGDGGSGGGSRGNTSNPGGRAIRGIQGNDGGNGTPQDTDNPAGIGGGGGGAGEAGYDGTISNSLGKRGNGGNGLQFNISGFSTYYAGGGGGSGETSQMTDALGGLGGGGNGNQGGGDTASPGKPNTGGGGGAGGHNSGINYTGKPGGSGIVIIRYLT